jgi:hypothetical protein
MSELHDRLYYDKDFKILYLKNKINGAYEPIMYDCVETPDSYDGKRIEKDSIFHYLIKFVRRLSTKINKKTGVKGIGYYEIYQWNLAIIMVKAAILLKNHDMMIAIARQSK